MRSLLHLLRQIKIPVLTILLYGQTSSISASALKQSQVLEKRVTINMDETALKDAFDRLAVASAVPIIYSNFKDLTAPVTLHAKNKTLRQILEDLTAPFSLTYKVIDDKIVIIHQDKKQAPAEQEQNKAPENKLTGKVTDSVGYPNSGPIKSRISSRSEARRLIEIL